jgi:hypothetical protein
MMGKEKEFAACAPLQLTPKMKISRLEACPSLFAMKARLIICSTALSKVRGFRFITTAQ